MNNLRMNSNPEWIHIGVGGRAAARSPHGRSFAPRPIHGSVTGPSVPREIWRMTGGPKVEKAILLSPTGISRARKGTKTEPKTARNPSNKRSKPKKWKPRFLSIFLTFLKVFGSQNEAKTTKKTKKQMRKTFANRKVKKTWFSVDLGTLFGAQIDQKS